MTGIFPIDDEFRHRALKRRDAWWVVLVIDPLALPVLAVLARLSSVTPMRLTVLGAALGVAAVASFGTGLLILGAILFELRFFVDCLDGKLARVRGMTSQRGAFLDLTMDVVLISSAMGALGWHLSRAPARIPLELSAACTVGCLILFWLILYDLDHPPVHSVRAARRESAWGRWLRHHRMSRLPGTIEVETGLLFVAPLIGNTWLLTAGFIGAGAYYVVASVHLFVKLLRRTSPPTASNPEDSPTTPLAP
jgi:phosphatidylglycerophosphate synthase